MQADAYSWQTREQRKRLAERLYGDGMTMQQIAAALNVSQATITRDLVQFIPANKLMRATGGRPKGSGSHSLFTTTQSTPPTNKPAPVVNKPAPLAAELEERDENPEPADRSPGGYLCACSFCGQEFEPDDVENADYRPLVLYDNAAVYELDDTDQQAAICADCTKDAYLILVSAKRYRDKRLQKTEAEPPAADDKPQARRKSVRS
jgi:hypothetical protein